MNEAHIAHLTHKLRMTSAQIRDIEAVRYPTPAQERFLLVLKAQKERIEEAIEAERNQAELFPAAEVNP